MKRILTLVIILLLLISMCFSSFATNTIDNNNNVANTDICTLTTKENGTEAAYYIVTIPAKVEIYWGATNTYIPFTVECQLETGKVLDFDVKGQNNYLLKDGVNGAIPYALLNGNFSLTESVIPETKVEDVLYVLILPEHWNQVSVDNYADLVTFTVSIKTK